MSKDELTKLIEKSMNGDAKAFEKLMELKGRHIIYLSMKLMRNQQDGEDAAQDAMLKMYHNIDKLKSPESFHSWMCQVVNRCCIDLKRKLARHDHEDLEQEGDLNEERREFLPQDYIEDVTKRDALMEIIDQMPDNYRACLLFFYFEDLTYQEIAQAMGTTTKIVDNVLQRAKRRLKRELEARYGEINPRSIFQGAVALPILSQAFQLDATALVSGEILARVVSGAGIFSAGATVAGGASATGTASVTGTSASASVATTSTVAGTAGATATTSATATAGALGVSTKIIIGVVAATAAVSGAAYGLLSDEQVPAEALDHPPAQTEAIILTLIDMIGEEAAETLAAYTEGEADRALWSDFLGQLNMTSLYGASEQTAAYTLYHLEKQDKQLLILEMRDGEQLEVAYRFTDRHEEAPMKGELIRSMDGWRQ